MRIGVDARVLMDKYYSGISEYTANLLKALLAVKHPDKYHLFYNSWHNLEDRFKIWETENSQVAVSHWPNKIFNYFCQLLFKQPKLDQVIGGVDLFWSPHFNFTSLTPGTKQIITVHDLSFLRYPEFFSAKKNFWHRALRVKKALKGASLIVAVSENTKQDIVELVGIAPEKIKVIYSGNNLVKREVREEELGFLSQKGIGTNFILYLGTIEPRKNISGLIRAYEELRRQGNRFNGLQLVLAGAKGWKSRGIYKAWQKSEYKNDIKFLGYISQKEKEVLYAKAKVFVYPSYYEGFGFPPLEAMTYGLPVICSNVSSLPEVVADAALMINPFKPIEIMEALELILSDEKLRENLINKGYQRASEFSWEKTAQEYLRLFQEL